MRPLLLGKGQMQQLVNKCYIHYYFGHHGLGQTDAQLNADYCTRQNKNNSFLWYLAWRTLMKLHHSITYSFLIAGHTKFAPDCSFRLIKESFQSHLRFVALWIYAACRDLQHYWTKQSTTCWHANRRVVVAVYDWSTFLGKYFKNLPNIKKFHHFRFSNKTPGMVFYKELVSSPEQSFMLLKKNAIFLPPLTLPEVVNPEGLIEERRNYLFREIRQFCKPGTEDIVATAPWN